jgi:hypothetical protein
MSLMTRADQDRRGYPAAAELNPMFDRQRAGVDGWAKHQQSEPLGTFHPTACG